MKTKLLLAVIITTVTSIAFAATEQPTPTPLPMSGNLASSVTAGSAGGAPGSWASDVLVQSPAPIGGSVSRSGNSWLAKVFNNSEDSYSANFKVIQLHARGDSIRNDYFSVTLAPGKSSERTYSVANGAVSANLELASWKKLGGDKKEEEKDAAVADASKVDEKSAGAKPKTSRQ